MSSKRHQLRGLTRHSHYPLHTVTLKFYGAIVVEKYLCIQKYVFPLRKGHLKGSAIFVPVSSRET